MIVTDTERAEVLKRALIRMGLLQENARFPKPYTKATGMAGKSTVWLLKLPTGRHVVAKFDTPERAKTEWRAVSALRRVGMLPGAIVPLESNQPADNVAVYQGVSQYTSSGRVRDFRQLVEKQLRSNTDNCLSALTQTFDALKPLYRGTVKEAIGRRVVKWSSQFPKLCPRSLQADLEGNRKLKAAWRTECHTRTGVSDPLRELGVLLREPVGNVMIAQVHGDLNFCNVLFGQNGQAAPKETFIIDWARWRQEAVTATDPALMETQFWHDCWPRICPDEEEAIEAMIAVGRYYNGDSQTLSDGGQSPVATFIHGLRSHAFEILGAGNRDYCMHDYMIALYLQFVRALSFPTVKRSQLSLRLTYAGVCLARRFLDKWDGGNAPAFPDAPASVRKRPPVPRQPSASRILRLCPRCAAEAGQLAKSQALEEFFDSAASGGFVQRLRKDGATEVLYCIIGALQASFYGRPSEAAMKPLLARLAPLTIPANVVRDGRKLLQVDPAKRDFRGGVLTISNNTDEGADAILRAALYDLPCQWSDASFAAGSWPKGEKTINVADVPTRGTPVPDQINDLRRRLLQACQANDLETAKDSMRTWLSIGFPLSVLCNEEVVRLLESVDGVEELALYLSKCEKTHSGTRTVLVQLSEIAGLLKSA